MVRAYTYIGEGLGFGASDLFILLGCPDSLRLE